MLRFTKRARFLRDRSTPVLAIGVLLFVSFGASISHAQSEDEIKAAFLLNFARYVDWPPPAFSTPASPVEICILDADGFSSVVDAIVAGKKVDARPVVVMKVTDAASAEHCHILFIGKNNVAPARVVAAIGGKDVFTVGDAEGFAKLGGVANFIRSDNKIRFEINPGAAASAGLKISSRLLRLAQLVE